LAIRNSIKISGLINIKINLKMSAPKKLVENIFKYESSSVTELKSPERYLEFTKGLSIPKLLS
jgi:hypothetical protein